MNTNPETTMSEADTKRWSISQAEQITGLSRDYLRRIERDGLLFPGRATAQGLRLYSASDLLLARRIYDQRLARHGKSGIRRPLPPTRTEQ
jgi:hypothetical protein